MKGEYSHRFFHNISEPLSIILEKLDLQLMLIYCFFQ